MRNRWNEDGFTRGVRHVNFLDAQAITMGLHGRWRKL